MGRWDSVKASRQEIEALRAEVCGRSQSQIWTTEVKAGRRHVTVEVVEFVDGGRGPSRRRVNIGSPFLGLGDLAAKNARELATALVQAADGCEGRA